jgi:cell division protein FtsL
MTEFYTVKRIDNSRLAHPGTRRLDRDCLRFALFAAVLAAVVLVYAWQHFQYLELGYQLEQLKTGQSQALEFNQQLRVELGSLRSPHRIDAIARTQLGLTPPTPAQVAPLQPVAGGELAQARSSASPMRR